MGARHRGSPPAVGGGGYPDICISEEPPVGGDHKNARGRDPLMDELREMGVGHLWLQVAEGIGAEAFIEIWEILDRALGDAVRRDAYVPNYSTYTAYQRNRFIQALSAAGHGTQEIRRMVKCELHETLTPRHILRVVAGGKG